MVEKYRYHIVVNTRLLLKDRIAGIGRFSLEVLQRMVDRNPDIKFSFLFDRKFAKQFVLGPNVHPYVIPPQARHPVLWYSWFHISNKWMLNRLKPDLYFSPEWYICPNASIPTIATFHDLAYEHFPEDIGGWASRYCLKYSPIYARKASHILTVSSFSKQDIVDRYQFLRKRSL